MIQLFHGYQVIRPLASNTFSNVYLAQAAQEATDKVVFKVFHSILLDQEQEQKVFLREVDKLKQLNHPYILPLLDGGITNGHPFLVSRYASQDSLRCRLDPSSSLRPSTADALQIIVRVGQALAYAHSWKILHGNIKPENVLFDVDEKALLADFIPFSLLSPHTPDQPSHTASPSYIAPEQVAGSATKESDQFALGCLAYELLSGQSPFAVNASVFPVPMSTLVPDLSEHVENAVLKALASKPTERHASVSAFLEAFTALSLKVTLSPQASPATQSFPMRAVTSLDRKSNDQARTAQLGRMLVPQHVPSTVAIAVPQASPVASVIHKPVVASSVTLPFHQRRKIWIGLALICLLALLTGLVSLSFLPAQQSMQVSSPIATPSVVHGTTTTPATMTATPGIAGGGVATSA